MNTQEAQEVWNTVCSHIQKLEYVESSEFKAIFYKLNPIAFAPGFFLLATDNQAINFWVRSRYLELITLVLEDLFGVTFNVEIFTTPSDANKTASRAGIHSQNKRFVDTNQTLNNPSSFQRKEQESFRTLNTSEEIDEGFDTQSPAIDTVVHEPLKENFPSRNIQTNEPSLREILELNKEDVSHTRFSSEYSQDNQEQAILKQNDPLEFSDAEDPFAPKEELTIKNPLTTCTFENFVIGDSNKMAYTMAYEVAKNPGKVNLDPLFIYGKSGLGKTHLLFAIVDYIEKHHPHLNVRYMDSNEFIDEYTNASISNDTDKYSFQKFITLFTNLDVLLIDDIQVLQGKSGTLNQIFQVFNSLIGQKKQIVLASDRAPKNIDVDERMQSRFNQGGTFDIQPPKYETKMAIIKSFVASYQEVSPCDNLSIDPEIFDYISQNSGSNIREIKSALIMIFRYMEVYRINQLSLKDIRNQIDNHLTDQTERLTIEEIVNQVSQFYKINEKDILGNSRTKDIAWARHVAIYLSRTILNTAFKEIGKYFNRDHSTIMSSVTKVETTIKNKRESLEEIELLKNLILDR